MFSPFFQHEQSKGGGLPWTKQWMAWELHSLCRAVSLGFLQWCWISAVHDEWQAGLQRLKTCRTHFNMAQLLWYNPYIRLLLSTGKQGLGPFSLFSNLNMDKEPLCSLSGQNKSLFTTEPASHRLITALCTCSFKLTAGISLTEIISERLCHIILWQHFRLCFSKSVTEQNKSLNSLTQLSCLWINRKIR